MYYLRGSCYGTSLSIAASEQSANVTSAHKVKAFSCSFTSSRRVRGTNVCFHTQDLNISSCKQCVMLKAPQR